MSKQQEKKMKKKERDEKIQAYISKCVNEYLNDTRNKDEIVEEYWKKMADFIKAIENK